MYDERTAQLLAEVSTLKDAVRAQDQFIAEQNAALRKLREDCARMSTTQYTPASPARIAFASVVQALDTILDNVTGVERQVDPQTGLDL